MVDEIPLVLYIPAPPDEDEKSAPLGEDEDSDKMNTGLVKDGEGMDEAFSYPPKSSSTAMKKNSTSTSAQKKGNAKPKKRFAFLRIGRKSRKGDGSSKGTGGKGGRGDGDDDEGEWNWEDDWEKGEYPFVRMEGHRATCAICLMDFDEPPRVARGESSQRRRRLGRRMDQLRAASKMAERKRSLAIKRRTKSLRSVQTKYSKDTWRRSTD